MELNLQAQQVEWSNLERFRNKTAYNRVIGANQYGYYVLRSRNYDLKTKTIIERYRASLGLDFSKKVPNMRGHQLINAFAESSGIMLWKSRYNNDRQRIELVVENLNAEAEPVDGHRILCDAMPKNFSDDGDFVVHSNQRQSHFVVLNTEQAPKGQSYLNVRVFDRELNPVCSTRQVMEFENRQFDLEQVVVDSAGNAFILISGVNGEMRKGSPERIGVHLFALANDASWFDFYLNFDDTYIHSPVMSLDEINGKLIVSGLYSLNGLNTAKGVLDFGLQTQGFKLLYHNFIPWTYDFVSDVAGEKAAQEEEELVDFVVRDIVARSDGGYILFGEEFSISQQSYTYYVNGIAQVSSRSVYNYGKIFLVSIGPNGALEWTRIISKGQSSVNDYGYYSSFTLCKRKDRIHILFNDKLKGNGGVLHFVLHNDGSLDEGTLFGNQSAFISIVPSEAAQLDARTLLIPTSKDRKFAFVKLVF